VTVEDSHDMTAYPWRGIGAWRSYADAVSDGEPEEEDDAEG
jgi:hypothetical protein